MAMDGECLQTFMAPNMNQSQWIQAQLPKSCEKAMIIQCDNTMQRLTTVNDNLLDSFNNILATITLQL